MSIYIGVNGKAQEVKENSVANIIETWKSGTSWYRKWSDGWIEQGGIITAVVSSGSGYTDVNLPIKYSDTNYSIQLTINTEHINLATATVVPSKKTALKFQFHYVSYSIYESVASVSWQTAGY